MGIRMFWTMESNCESSSLVHVLGPDLRFEPPLLLSLSPPPVEDVEELYEGVCSGPLPFLVPPRVGEECMGLLRLALAL